MKKIVLAIVVVFLPMVLPIAQDLPNKENPKFILSPGISYQTQIFGELNLMFTKSIIEHGRNVIYGPRIGIESNFDKHNFIYAPKVGYEISGMIFSFRGSAIGYINEKRLDLRILPEAGISFFGTLNLTYGYSLPILTFRASDLGNHKINLTANLHRDLWQAL